MPRKAPVAATSAAPKATAAAATWRSTTQGELPLAATAPPRAIATSRSARAAEVRRTSLRYAHRATIVTTSPVAAAAPTTETRKTTPGVAGSGDSSGPIGLTQPLAEIVQRSGARHVRDGVEVVRRRRRRRVPLQRVRLPGVVADPWPAPGRADDVPEEEQECDSHDVRADRRSHVVALP